MEQSTGLPRTKWPGPDDVAYQSEAQAGGFGQTLASFVKFVDLPAGGAILDVGTGPGLVARLLAARARLIVGCDRSPEMLRHARTLSPSTSAFPGGWLVADALQLPFRDGRFDAVLATNLLFLFADPACAVRELARVVAVGGAIGWLNPSAEMGQASAAAFADARGLTGFARFSLINYGRLAEGYGRFSDDAWAAMARSAGIQDIVVDARAGGLMTLLKGRKRGDG